MPRGRPAGWKQIALTPEAEKAVGVIAADLGAKFPGAMLDLSALINSLLISKAKEIEAGK